MTFDVRRNWRGLCLVFLAAASLRGGVTFTDSAFNPSDYSMVGLPWPSFTYYPATQGTIQSIDFSVEKYSTYTGCNACQLDTTNTARLLVLRNGMYYMAVVPLKISWERKCSKKSCHGPSKLGPRVLSAEMDSTRTVRLCSA